MGAALAGSKGRRNLSRHDALGIFEDALAALHDLRTLDAVRSHMAEGVYGYGFGPVVTGGGTSAPTERQGEELAYRRAEFEAEERRLTGRIALARDLCEGIRRSIGFKYATVMECRYLLDMPWKQVADVLGVSRTSAYRLRDVAIGELAERGTAYLRELGTRDDAGDGPREGICDDGEQ